MFSIITPSFQQLDWLRLALASAADQEGVDVEHIVQDAGSQGVEEMFKDTAKVPVRSGGYSAKLFVEKDAGMYDAINRGLQRASGEIRSYLNCDEQYLPGALRQVSQFFNQHPKIDVVFAHAVVVNELGQFIAYRKAILPSKYHTWVSNNMAILTCATFFRRRILDDHGLFFNPTLKDVGDAEWVMRILTQKLRMGILPIYTSTFTETNQNRNLAPHALREKAGMTASAPVWARTLRRPIITNYRLRRLVAGAYWQKPFEYAIYTRNSPSIRNVFRVTRPTFRWRL